MYTLSILLIKKLRVVCRSAVLPFCDLSRPFYRSKISALNPAHQFSTPRPNPAAPAVLPTPPPLTPACLAAHAPRRVCGRHGEAPRAAASSDDVDLVVVASTHHAAALVDLIFGAPPHGVPARPPPPAPRRPNRPPPRGSVPRLRRHEDARAPPHSVPARPPPPAPRPPPRVPSVPRLRRHELLLSVSPHLATCGLPRCRDARSQPPSSPWPMHFAWAPRRPCYPRMPGGRPSLGLGSEAPCLGPSSSRAILAVGGGCCNSPSCR
jgi:hypothetical protein